MKSSALLIVLLLLLYNPSRSDDDLYGSFHHVSPVMAMPVSGSQRPEELVCVDSLPDDIANEIAKVDEVSVMMPFVSNKQDAVIKYYFPTVVYPDVRVFLPMENNGSMADMYFQEIGREIRQISPEIYVFSGYREIGGSLSSDPFFSKGLCYKSKKHPEEAVLVYMSSYSSPLKVIPEADYSHSINFKGVHYPVPERDWRMWDVNPAGYLFYDKSGDSFYYHIDKECGDVIKVFKLEGGVLTEMVGASAWGECG